MSDDLEAEIVRLRGELVLWKAAAALTLDEQKTIVDAILVAVAGGHTSTARRLNWLRGRLMFPVAEQAGSAASMRAQTMTQDDATQPRNGKPGVCSEPVCGESPRQSPQAMR